MNNMSYLLGSLPLGLFLGMIFFAAIGILMALLIDSTKRDQASKNTPVKFSFWFLLKDNWKTILLTALAVLMTLRFAPILFPDQFNGENLSSPLGTDKWLFGSLLIGLLYNTLLQIWKDKAEFLKAKR